MTSAASAGSRSEKPGGNPSGSAKLLMSWCATAWNVPPRSRRAELSVTAQGSSPGEHVVGSPPREGQEQDPLGRQAPLEQAGHPRRQRASLAGAGAGHDHERVVTMDDRGRAAPRRGWRPIRVRRTYVRC